MPRFQVGDHIVGNRQARSRYSFTTEGWHGFVWQVNEGDNCILVSDHALYNDQHEFDGICCGPYWVDACCFDHVDTEKQPTEDYSCPECNSSQFYDLRNGITFRCDDCGMEFDLIDKDRKLFKTVAMKRLYHTRYHDEDF